MKPFELCKGLVTGRSNHFADERGLFSTMTPLFTPVHLNLSKSNSRVVRGLHYQAGAPQGKLVWCLGGHGIDVALDLRLESKTYGKLFYATLGTGDYVFVPQGFAHGLISLEKLEVIYAVDAPYQKDLDTGINIDSIPEMRGYMDFKRSDKDRNLPHFSHGAMFIQASQL